MKKRIAFKWALYACVLLIAFLVQTTAGIKLAGVSANLVTPVTATVAMFEGAVGGACFGFAAGLMLDALIHPSEAFFTLFMTLTGLLIGRMCDVYFRKRLFTAALWAFFALALQSVLYFAVFYLTTGRAGTEALAAVALPETAFSMVFLPAAYIFSRAVYRGFGENNQ